MASVSTLDHLVIAAPELAEGVRWVEQRLGVPLEPGGRHVAFGTHNGLLSLGHDSYLEVIAVDPDARPPRRPRWFELDTPAMRRRLASGPALVHWVVRVSSLDGEPDVMELSRGTNEWALTVPPDGRMPLGGLAPSRILWHTPPPSTLLPDRGIRLVELRLTTPDTAALTPLLSGVGVAVTLAEGRPGISATFLTSSGEVTLGRPTVIG